MEKLIFATKTNTISYPQKAFLKVLGNMKKEVDWEILGKI
jgi:hypothetical protein